MKTNVLVTGTGRNSHTRNKWYYDLYLSSGACEINEKGYFGTALINKLIENDFEVTAFGSVRFEFMDDQMSSFLSSQSCKDLNTSF